MICPKCGYDNLPGGSRFCPTCGAPVPEAPVSPAQIVATQKIGSAWHSTIIGVQQIFAPRRGEQYRHILLTRVRDRWLDGEGDWLSKGAPIELAIEERLDLLDRQPNRMLPPNPPIADIFEDAGRKLLIVGAPGSGKKEKLIELTRVLIECAKDDREPMPVILSLFSWPREHCDNGFFEWLVDEISEKHDGIGRKLCIEWLENRELVLLIHGLDRVEEKYQAACVRAINDFLRDWDPVQIVVCCRTSDYEALSPPRLNFRSAIELHSLTSRQVDTYLAGAGPELAALRTVLEDDWALRELARSPLYLSIMSDIYRDKPVERMEPLASIEARREELWVDYVDCAFAKQGEDPPYKRKQIEGWLTWLAQMMKEHKQDLFLIEGMQPDWLSTEKQQHLHTIGSWLATGFVFGLPVGLTFGLAFGQAVGLGRGLAAGLTFALTLGLLGGLAFFGLTRRLILGPTFGLVSGLATGLAVGLAFGPLSGLTFGAIAVSAGLAFGFLPSGLTSERKRIKVIETLNWSWPRAILGLIFGAACALASGAVVGLFVGSTKGLSIGLFFSFFIGPVLAVVGGITGGEIEVEDKEVPNQGIRRSAKNAIRVGLLAALAFGLPVGLAEPTIGYVPVGASIWVGGLRDGLALGLTLGIGLGLVLGGITCIQHAILRLILWRKHHIPWNYRDFLDYVADHGLLKRRGGAYEFRHQRLRDYFAELRE